MTIKIDNSRTVMIQAEMGYVQCVTESGHGYTKPHILSNIIVNPTGFIIKLNCERTKLETEREVRKMADKLKKIGVDLERARAKREEWDRKVRELEKKYTEEENTQIHEIVRAANLTPEELAVIIRKAAVSMPDRPAEDVVREAGYDED